MKQRFKLYAAAAWSVFKRDALKVMYGYVFGMLLYGPKTAGVVRTSPLFWFVVACFTYMVLLDVALKARALRETAENAKAAGQIKVLDDRIAEGQRRLDAQVDELYERFRSAGLRVNRPETKDAGGGQQK